MEKGNVHLIRDGFNPREEKVFVVLYPKSKHFNKLL
jgi:hypothetical protein